MRLFDCYLLLFLVVVNCFFFRKDTLVSCVYCGFDYSTSPGGGIWTHNVKSGTRGGVLFSKTEKVEVEKRGGAVQKW
jgi:hypothetical protein